jgi:hypothetical protein
VKTSYRSPQRKNAIVIPSWSVRKPSLFSNPWRTG